MTKQTLKSFRLIIRVLEEMEEYFQRVQIYNWLGKIIQDILTQEIVLFKTVHKDMFPMRLTHIMLMGLMQFLERP